MPFSRQDPWQPQQSGGFSLLNFAGASIVSPLSSTSHIGGSIPRPKSWAPDSAGDVRRAQPPTPVTTHQVPPYSVYSSMPALPPQNTKDLSPEMLRALLDHLSLCLEPPHAFNRSQVILVVHGGVVPLLHPALSKFAEALETGGTRYSIYQSQSASNEIGSVPRRKTTRDVDFIARGFNNYWSAVHGIDDGLDRFNKCVKSTAYAFYNCGIGEDWINSDADVSLPMTVDQTGNPYDPVVRAALEPANMRSNTLYESPNKLLKLVSVSTVWAVALKMERYSSKDSLDITLLLRWTSPHWTEESLESWLRKNCSALLYDTRGDAVKKKFHRNVKHAIRMLSGRNRRLSEGGGEIPRPSTTAPVMPPMNAPRPPSRMTHSTSWKPPQPPPFIMDDSNAPPERALSSFAPGHKPFIPPPISGANFVRDSSRKMARPRKWMT